MRYILAIDQGTTSSRAILFDAQMQPAAVAQQEFTQHYPASGWVEHEPEDLWTSVLATCRDCLDKAGVSAGDLAGIGITNQRETTVVWDAETGAPLHRAIVWQDRRTADLCARLKAEGAEAEVTARTGLLLDPYFSATKVKWILDQVDGARERAAAGKVLFGTVDAYLIWRLTGGARRDGVHAPGATELRPPRACSMLARRGGDDPSAVARAEDRSTIARSATGLTGSRHRLPCSLRAEDAALDAVASGDGPRAVDRRGPSGYDSYSSRATGLTAESSRECCLTRRCE